ncbi:MAG: hypothetical protein AB7P99_17705, partial [Vicinamibacterales bacterium]
MTSAAILEVGGRDERERSYSFRGWRRSQLWPMAGGSGLGVAGAWNFLLRTGRRPLLLKPADVGAFDDASLLVVCLDRAGAGAATGALRARIARGGRVLASGSAEGWRAVLPEQFAGTTSTPEQPDAGLAYRFGDRVGLVGPPRWPVFSCDRWPDDAVGFGEVVAVGGERQTPARALLTRMNGAAAVVRWKGVVFLNGSPFHALQAWLQGQEDVEPWMAWRHRLFWLDEFVGDLLGWLRIAGVELPPTGPTPVAGLAATTVVLRHDLDYSRDTAYIDLEDACGVPAVHAVLRDRNTRFWVERLRRSPEHEVAFHYNTARFSRVWNRLRTTLGFPATTYAPARTSITRHGLRRQVAWARRHGVAVGTLHRHLPFLIYPEWIDAFDEVLTREATVLGGSSLFRGQVLRWGVDRADGMRGTYAQFPDAQFPLWMPFKVAHAAEQRILRGWESASVMEAEPELVAQLLSHRV